MYSEYLQQCFAPWLLFHLKNSVSISRDNFTWHKGAGINYTYEMLMNVFSLTPLSFYYQIAVFVRAIQEPSYS